MKRFKNAEICDPEITDPRKKSILIENVEGVREVFKCKYYSHSNREEDTAHNFKYPPF